MSSEDIFALQKFLFSNGLYAIQVCFVLCKSKSNSDNKIHHDI